MNEAARADELLSNQESLPVHLSLSIKPACTAARPYPQQSRNACLLEGFISQDFKAGFRSLGLWQVFMSSVATYYFCNVFSVVECLLVLFSSKKKKKPAV